MSPVLCFVPSLVYHAIMSHTRPLLCPRVERRLARFIVYGNHVVLFVSSRLVYIEIYITILLVCLQRPSCHCLCCVPCHWHHANHFVDCADLEWHHCHHQSCLDHTCHVQIGYNRIKSR